MTRTEAIATLTEMNSHNDNVNEYADSSEWSLKDLRAELKNAEEVTTLVALDYVIAVREARIRFTVAELDAIAGVA